MKFTESAEQRAFIQWARAYPQTRLFFAIPNGGKRNAIEAKRLQLEGVLPGVPDLMLPVPSGECHGLFLEFKTGSGRTSPSQAMMLDALVQRGYCCAVVYNAAVAIDVTQQYLTGMLGAALFIRK